MLDQIVQGDSVITLIGFELRFDTFLIFLFAVEFWNSTKDSYFRVFLPDTDVQFA